MEIRVKQTVNFVQKMDKIVFSDGVKNKFLCQCGKFYNAFPALYLHFQRSHKIKISTKLQEQLCSITKVGDVRTFNYFFSKENFESHKNKNHYSAVFSVLSEFIEAILNQWDKFPAYYLCSCLYKYLVEEKIIDSPSSEVAVIHTLPNYFNDFMAKKLLLMQNPQTYKYNCTILLTLGQWLNLQGYSKVKVEHNKETNQIDFQQEKEVQKTDKCKIQASDDAY